MQRMSVRGAFLSLGVLLFVSSASAQLLGTSSRQLPAGSLRLLTYYSGVSDQTVRFNVRGTGSCVSQNGVTFGCNQTGDVDGSGDGAMGAAKLVWQPWDILQYYGVVGAGGYRLKVPGANGDQYLSGDNPGVMGTLGVRGTIYPDTVVTPAIALDASISDTRYAFNRATGVGSGAQTTINQALSLWRYQVALEAGHQFSVESWKVEPYGGLKWTRTQADLLDRQTGGHSGGRIDVVSPFLGVKVPASEHEAFFAEAAFVEGYQYGAGLEVRFK